MDDTLKRIQEYSLEEIMGSRFGRYAKYIIQDRAIPDVRDGLKPVQRRILYAMYKSHNTFEKSTVKSAQTVGDVIGKYHPHGDTSVYDAMVRMSQSWKQRVPYILFQGNNGSIDGDPPAAYRYTEAKLAKISNEMLRDIDKDAVIFAPTFDDSRMEPTVLPARYPNLLVNGTTGISAGYATNIPTHNLGEVIDATIKRIDNPNCRLDTILEIVKGPDFPTGGVIEGKDEIRKAYETGKGKIIVKCKYEFEKNKGKESIVITEVPYEVTLTAIVKKIEDIRIDKKIDGILEARNETGKDGIRIVIDLKPGANKDLILNYLLKNTDMQVSYGINMVAVVNRRPKQLGILPMLDAYIEHQKDVVRRRTKFELAAYMKEMHILEGLIKALSVLDELIKVIRASKNKSDAKINIINKFGFTEAQAEAIVTLQLYKLTNTDVVELQNRHAELKDLIEYANKILAFESELLGVIKQELRSIKKEFATPRLTEIKDEITEIKIDEMAMINKDDYIVTLTKDGYIKKISIKSFNSNNEELPLKDGDYLLGFYKMNNINTLLAFTDKGNYLYVPVYEIDEVKFKDLGKHINTIVSLSDNENIIGCYPVTNFKQNTIITVFTRDGMTKRMKLEDFEVSRFTKPVTLMKVKEGDKVVSVFTEDSEEVLCVTELGFGLRYNIDEIPVLGLKASGVKAIKLTDGDSLVSAVPLVNPDYVTLFTENGTAKRIKLPEIQSYTRAKKGISIIKSPKTKLYNVLKCFNNETKNVFGVVHNDDIKEVKASEISFYDKLSVGGVVSKKEITNVFIFTKLSKVEESSEVSEVKEEKVIEEIKEEKTEKEVVVENMTMSDFFDEFKL